VSDSFDGFFLDIVKVNKYAHIHNLFQQVFGFYYNSNHGYQSNVMEITKDISGD